MREESLKVRFVYSLARQGKGGIRSGRVDSDLRKGLGLGFPGAALIDS